jgi:hypothetical protein
VIRRLPAGDIDAAFQVVYREDSDLFGKRDFTAGIVHVALRDQGSGFKDSGLTDNRNSVCRAGGLTNRPAK